jgi:predicted amidohydrolase
MQLNVALIRMVFPDRDAIRDLRVALKQAYSQGAQLAVLPEIPLNVWSPASKVHQDDEAEPPAGARHRAMSDAAREVGIALIGGAIIRDPKTGRCHNTALAFDKSGELIGSYRKLHLPDEEGFWETTHYDPGDCPPSVIHGLSLPIGIQICSDVNRPEGSHLLGALGAEVIVCPRATEAATFARWKTVLTANAITSCTYVISVPRPQPEFGVPLGGPSFAVAPTGEVLVESTETMILVTLDRNVLDHVRRSYPGYLPVRAELYAEGWKSVTSQTIADRSSTRPPDAKIPAAG